ncbi:MAG: hypothetical protein DA330_09830 [Nitrososphaera sp.]|nr:hypothetical protein [Nitrososphaera sp.]
MNQLQKNVERGPVDTPDIDETRGDELPLAGIVQFRIYHGRHSQVDDCDDFDGLEFVYTREEGLEFEAPRPPLHPWCSCYFLDVDKQKVIKFRGSEWEGRENG